MHNRGIILLVLTVFFIHCTWASSLHRSARQATSTVALGANGYCGGYNDVDCSAVCYWNRFNYYQCRPDQCYCF